MNDFWRSAIPIRCAFAHAYHLLFAASLDLYRLRGGVSSIDDASILYIEYAVGSFYDCGVMCCYEQAYL